MRCRHRFLSSTFSLAVIATCLCILWVHLFTKQTKGARFVQSWTNTEATFVENMCPKWVLWRDSYRQCMVKKCSEVPIESLHEHWIRIWKECFKETNIINSTNQFNMGTYKNADESKMVVKQSKSVLNTAQNGCTVVTLGVGGDILAEQKMKVDSPNCQFYGADPIRKYGEMYSKVGTYFEIAVGAKNGVMNASVLIGPGGADYDWKAVSAVDLATFLTKYINKTIIDHLWMDNEGPEYRLLPMMQRGGVFEENGIVLCQMNAELHFPLKEYAVDEKMFGSLLINFLEKSDFVLLELAYYRPHYRPFFVNAYDPYCIRKYFGDWC